MNASPKPTNFTKKLSYSCMANRKQKIDNHNRKIMSNGREREGFTRTCSCRDKPFCPLKRKCLQEGVAHKAIVTQTETMKQDISYIGMTEYPFKTRYNLHNSSFRLPHKRSTTTLSEHLWTLKDFGVIHKTEWTILDKAKPCSPAARKCELCLTEKYHILLEKSRLLNKRSEIFGTCPHRRKYLLQNSDRSNEENSA